MIVTVGGGGAIETSQIEWEYIGDQRGRGKTEFQSQRTNHQGGWSQMTNCTGGVQGKLERAQERRSWVQVYPALTDHPRISPSPARINSLMAMLGLRRQPSRWKVDPPGSNLTPNLRLWRSAGPEDRDDEQKQQWMPKTPHMHTAHQYMKIISIIQNTSMPGRI